MSCPVSFRLYVVGPSTLRTIEERRVPSYFYALRPFLLSLHCACRCLLGPLVLAAYNHQF